MTSLLESCVLWSGLSWLCLLVFALWFIALLFPLPEPSDDAALDNGDNSATNIAAPTNKEDL